MRRWTTDLPRSEEAAAAPPRPPAWVEALALGIPLAVLAALSLYQLGALSFWRDEVVSIVFASAPLGDLLTVVGRDRDQADLANMATYYVLLHFWLEVSHDEAWVRILSVVFGLASVIPVYLIARSVAGWTTGALAAVIFALMPFVVHYNREARPYSLSVLVAGLLTWLLLAGTERSGTLPWVAYGVVAALGLYVHPFVALVIGAHVLWLLATRQMPGWPKAAAAMVPILAAAAPIPLILLENAGAQAWIPPLTSAVARAELVGLAGGVPLLLAMTALLAWGLRILSTDRRAWLLVTSVLVPIGVAALVSVVKPVFIDRYLIMVLPMLAIFLAWTIVRMRPPILAPASALALGALLVVAVPSAYQDANQQDWRSAGRWVASEAEAGDAMIAQNGRRSLEYYVEAAGGAAPHSTRVALALDDAATRRVWVAVLGDQDPGYLADVPDRLSARYEIAERRTFGARLSILLMTRRPAG